jgi:adenine deaminase
MKIQFIISISRTKEELLIAILFSTKVIPIFINMSPIKHCWNIERHTAVLIDDFSLFTKGFGICEGAIASSFAHDSHNIIAVGANDRDMSQQLSGYVK